MKVANPCFECQDVCSFAPHTAQFCKDILRVLLLVIAVITSGVSIVVITGIVSGTRRLPIPFRPGATSRHSLVLEIIQHSGDYKLIFKFEHPFFCVQFSRVLSPISKIFLHDMIKFSDRLGIYKRN
ncbi:hypothetical protein KC19_10G042800 [Ceratodon purpureus]|uniref:Uncharacterized protein n=1 Tax=Ceratodon purpureus TaxID=3225 RepID=A0A8T0GGS4_CERPU|nr:hypothetical protein KC19_10G042800 [Ceratodon purpureus]